MCQGSLVIKLFQVSARSDILFSRPRFQISLNLFLLTVLVMLVVSGFFLSMQRKTYTTLTNKWYMYILSAGESLEKFSSYNHESNSFLNHLTHAPSVKTTS